MGMSCNEHWLSQPSEFAQFELNNSTRIVLLQVSYLSAVFWNGETVNFIYFTSALSFSQVGDTKQLS